MFGCVSNDLLEGEVRWPRMGDKWAVRENYCVTYLLYSKFWSRKRIALKKKIHLVIICGILDIRLLTHNCLYYTRPIKKTLNAHLIEWMIAFHLWFFVLFRTIHENYEASFWSVQRKKLEKTKRLLFWRETDRVNVIKKSFR